MILTLHNINFYQELMTSIRENIKKGTFDQFHDNYINKFEEYFFISIYSRKK